jgi:hypothetical protein
MAADYDWMIRDVDSMTVGGALAATFISRLQSVPQAPRRAREIARRALSSFRTVFFASSTPTVLNFSAPTTKRSRNDG